MKSEWKKVELGDYIEVKHGYAFEGKYFSEIDNKLVLLTPGNFNIGGGFKRDKSKFYNSRVPDEYKLKPNDLVVTMTDLSKKSDSLGYPALIPDDDYIYLHNQRIGKIECKSSLIDPKFLYYLLCSPSYRKEIIASSTGTTVKHTAPKRIKSYKFLLPTLAEQVAISNLLHSLDKKIDLNRKLCKILEDIASALFKSWFIDFDPVHAKAMGEQPKGMSSEIADLFPDKFVDSKLGKIPKDWEVVSLSKIAKFLNGLTLQKYPTKSDKEFLPVIKIAELNKGITAQTDKASLDIPADYIINPGDVLFSWSGSLLIKIWTGEPGALNQHLFKVTSLDYPKWFYFFWLSYHLENFRLIASSKATTMGHIKRHHLDDAKILLPPLKLLRFSDNVFNPLMEKFILTERQTHSLVKIRDTILPSLISGELNINDANEEIWK